MLYYPFQDIKVLLNLDSINLKGKDKDLNDQVQTYIYYQLNYSPYLPNSLFIEIEVPNDNEFKEASNTRDTNDSL